MALNFLGILLISAFLTGVQLLTRTKVKRPKPDDFAVPKAEEGALVPQGYGLFASAGNVVYSGQVVAEQFPEGGAFYRACMIIRLALGPLTRLIDLQWAEKSLVLEPLTKAQSSGGTATGTAVPAPGPSGWELTGDGPLTLQVHARQMFGGKLQEGGVEGEVRLYRGTLNQPIDELTVQQYDRLFPGSGLGSRRPGVAHICLGTVASPFLFGTTAQPKNMVALLQYIPRALFDLNLDPTNYTSPEIGNECNPAEFLYEIKKDELRGLGQLEAEFDLASFVATAARLQAEGLGMSYPGATATPARTMIADVCNTFDLVLHEALATGRWTLQAVRPDDRAGDVVAVTPSTVIKGSLSVTRPDWSGTKTEVVLRYRRFDVSTGQPVTGELLTPNLVFYVTKKANALQLRGKRVSDVHLFGDDGSGPVEIDPSAYQVDALSGLVRILVWGVADLGTGFQQHTRVTANYLAGPFMGFRDASVRKEDDANRQRLGRPEPLELDSAYITNSFVAGWVCARALHKEARRLARARFKVNRSAYTLRPGSPIDVTDERTATIVAMRVSDLDLGLLEQGEIGVEAIEDVFGADVAPAFPPGPNTTPGVLRTAPPMAALYCSGADTLTLQASDPAFSIELQRADDTDGTGAETVSESPLPGDTTTYVDATSGKTHRARLVRDDWLPGPWTPWVAVCTTGDDVCTLPAIVDSPIVAGLVGTLAVEINDPQLRVQSVAFRVTAADGAVGAWTTDSATPYEATVELVDGFTAYIARRVTYYDCDATLVTAEATYPFAVAAEPPDPEVGLTRLPVDLSFDCPINVLEIPLARTPITPWRSAELQYPFTDHRLIRFEATVLRAGTVGSYLAGEIEPTGAPGIYAPMAEDGVGPLLPLDEASLDLLDPAGALLVPKQWVVVSESVPIRDEAKADLRARVVIGGGDDATGDVLLGRLAFQVVAGPTEAVEPPEVHDPPPDDPGSCTTPSTLDVTDFDSELEPSGATWSIDGTDAVLTLDGTGSGEASQTTDFTGLEPDQEYTFYLTVNPDAAVEAFLEVVGGDRAVSTGTGSQTLVARGVTDGSGNLSVTRGVTAIEDAPASAGSDPLSHADQAAAEAAGWVFTNTNTGGSFEFASGVDVGPFGTSMALRAKNNGVGLLRMERTFSVVNGQNYRGRVWADASETEPWWSAMELRLTSGANVFADSINGGVAEKHLDVTIVASGTSLTARIEIEPVDFYGGVKPWRIAGFTLDGVAGGGATVRFSDLGSCVGSGLGDGGTGVGDGDGEGGPGTDPVPDPGTDPTPAAPGDRPYGTFNINVGIVNVWNLVPKHFTVGNAINLINAARTAGSKLCFFSYGEPDWRDAAGVFRYLLWKAKWDLLIGNATVKAAIDAAIADGVIVFHYVIDEPYNRNVLPYGGPVAFVDAEKMCLDSKAAFPTLPTMIALAPRAAQQGWWMTRHMSGLDWLYHDWKPAHGDVTLFRDQNIDRAREIGHIFAPGIHYERFVGDRYIMPAELRHYGKILTDPRTGETENFAPFWLGWKFNAMMYATPDFQPADRSVRDNFRSNYP